MARKTRKPTSNGTMMTWMLNRELAQEMTRKTEENPVEQTNKALAELRRQKRNAKAKANRSARKEALDSLGMKRVRGSLGGVYYE